MTNITNSTTTMAAGPVKWLRRLVEAGIPRIKLGWRLDKNRRSVSRLLAWDARMLRDIGLTPNDVRAALAMPGSRDPSSHLGDLRRERRAAARATAREQSVRRRHTGASA